MPPAKLGAWQPQPCWGLTSVSQHLKIKQACGVKIIVILITVFGVVENALTPRFSKSHSLVVFSVMIFEMLLFQTQNRLVQFATPCDSSDSRFLLFQTQIRLRDPLWQDFAENPTFPMEKDKQTMLMHLRRWENHDPYCGGSIVKSWFSVMIFLWSGKSQPPWCFWCSSSAFLWHFVFSKWIQKNQLLSWRKIMILTCVQHRTT